MDQLLSKAKVDKNKLRYYINRITAEELTRLSEPCYYPPWKGYYFELLHLIGLTEKDFKEFINRYYIKTKAKDLILRDVGTNILIFIIHYFLKEKDIQSFLSAMTYLGIKFYSSRLRVHLKTYCNPDLFRFTLDNLSKTHLFVREKTIANAIFYTAKEMQRRFDKDILKFDDPDRISRFVYEYRHRIAQSVRSFAEAYYEFSKEGGKGYKKPDEIGEENEYQIDTMKKGQRLIDDITNKITVYKDINKKAVKDAQILTRINSNLVIMIINELHNTKYSDNIRLILELFVKELKNINTLCGNDYYKYVKNLMSIKRTTKPIYYKQQIQILTNLIIIAINYQKEYEKLTNQTKFSINSFISFYITMYLRNSVCF